MKVRLLVAYDGRPFHGWQSQRGGGTVQDILESAVEGIVGSRVVLHASGRTDAGVHALGQTVHFELSPEQTAQVQRLTGAGRWVQALNSVLPAELRVLRTVRAPAGFHARFSTTGKIYRYELWTGEVLPPLLAGRVWHLFRPVDRRIMERLARLTEGRHDFRGFCADSGSLPDSTVRILRRVRLRSKGPALSVTLEGDGFLYRMVRMLVGAMVRCAQGKEDPADFEKRLREAKPWHAPAMAPACGLYLVKALYGFREGKRRGNGAA
jgi:tRNA pseudouridine38-40 synthase